MGSSGPIELDDFDAILKLSPSWDHSYEQLGRGTASVRLTFAHTPSMELTVISRSPGVLFQGVPPRGMTVVAANLEGTTLHLQRSGWGRDLLGVAPDGKEFEIISPTPHTLFGLCVDHRRLDQAAWERWGRPFPARLSGPGLRFRDGSSRRRLVATWSRWLHRAHRQPAMLSDPDLVARMEQEVIGAVVCCAEPGLPAPPIRRRREVALRAERFLRRTLEEPVTIEEVCAAACASRPALHASFLSVLGTSPMAYRKALRLSAARRDLTTARQGTTVATVATRWGFYRLGQFAADYRDMFGEKPSDTLQRSTGQDASLPRVRPVPAVRVDSRDPESPTVV